MPRQGAPCRQQNQPREPALSPVRSSSAPGQSWGPLGGLGAQPGPAQGRPSAKFGCRLQLRGWGGALPAASPPPRESGCHPARSLGTWEPQPHTVGGKGGRGLGAWGPEAASGSPRQGQGLGQALWGRPVSLPPAVSDLPLGGPGAAPSTAVRARGPGCLCSVRRPPRLEGQGQRPHAELWDGGDAVGWVSPRSPGPTSDGLGLGSPQGSRGQPRAPLQAPARGR